MTSTTAERSNRMNARIRAAGGKATSLRLSPDAVRRIEALIRAGRARTQQDAIELALAEAVGEG